MNAPTTTAPGYIAGTWTIDSANSDVSFTVRHLGVAWVHGRFNEVTGEIVTGGTIDQSSVSVTIAADSIDTSFPGRDMYILGDDVLAVTEYKELSFVSTGVRVAGLEYFVDGDLTIRGVTKPVTLTVELGGFGYDPTKGQKVIGISATTTIKRADFDLSKNIPSAVIGDNVNIQLDIQASLNI